MLERLQPGDLDAISYHMYPGYGRSLDLPSLMPQPGWLDFSHKVMSITQRAAQATPAGRAAQLWIGETAAAWASGTAGVCDGFVSVCLPARLLACRYARFVCVVFLWPCV